MEDREKVIGFTCGPFDLCHPGHIILFEDCKNYCDYLIVGLHIDPSIENSRKNKPIESREERMIRLQSIRYVDDVETYTTYEELMQLMTRINLDVNIRGDDHKGDPPLAPQLSYREVFHKRAPYSSSDLRRRVYEAEKKLRER